VTVHDGSAPQAQPFLGGRHGAATNETHREPAARAADRAADAVDQGWHGLKVGGPDWAGCDLPVKYGSPRRMTPIDDGHAVHYTAVERGTPVYGSDEVEVGKVVEVLDNYREHILDGIVIEAGDGVFRFVDAPEVARTAERGVTLTIPAAEAEQLPPPERSRGLFRPRAGGLTRRLFGARKRR
jgi:hypothetical protein